MELALITYLISISSTVKGVFIFLACAAGILAFFLSLYNSLESKPIPKSIWWWIASCVFASFIAATIPSKKDSYLILGAYATQKVVTSESGKEIGDKVLEIITSNLDGLVKK